MSLSPVLNLLNWLLVTAGKTLAFESLDKESFCHINFVWEEVHVVRAKVNMLKVDNLT